jgi:flap endonuclease-1
MGIPVFEAPCEAEAQCAELARKGKVYATATEDMDALTFRTPKLVRKLTFSQMKGKEKQMIMEIDFEAMLAGLDITYEMFVDMCILCGCDYCSTIKGIGPKTALKLIKDYKTIENVVKNLDSKKYKVPDDWLPQRIPKKQLEEPEKEDEEEDEEVPEEVEDKPEGEADAATAVESSSAAVDQPESKEEDDELVDTDDEASVKADKAAEKSAEQIKAEENDEDYITLPPLYAQARQLFLQCDVHNADTVELKWEAPQEEKLTEFLVGRMGFSADRVASGIKRLKEAQMQKSQKRMDRLGFVSF